VRSAAALSFLKGEERRSGSSSRCWRGATIDAIFQIASEEQRSQRREDDPELRS
jgi:hypothetical protein